MGVVGSDVEVGDAYDEVELEECLDGPWLMDAYRDGPC